jgi:hypothetical protein
MYVLLYCGVCTGVRLLPPGENPIAVINNNNNNNNNHTNSVNKLQARTGHEGSRRLRLPKFLDNRHMKVVSLSALHTGYLYPLRDIPATHFC